MCATSEQQVQESGGQHDHSSQEALSDTGRVQGELTGSWWWGTLKVGGAWGVMLE